MAQFGLQVREYGSAGKVSDIAAYVPNLTAGTFDAQVALATALHAAINALTIGNLGKLTIDHLVSGTDPTPAASALAQRENKWLVSMRDTAGLTASFTIPCADLTLVGPDGETLDISAGVGLALVNAIEGYVLSKAGNAVTVESVKFRARTA